MAIIHIYEASCFWDVFTEVENIMILNGMDYLTIPVRFGQTGEIIQDGNL